MLFKSQCFVMTRSLCWLRYNPRHMAAVNAHDPNFHICCGIGCDRTYTNFYLFKKHLYRRHHESLEMAGPFTTMSEDPSTHTGGVGSDETLWDADVQPELERGNNTCMNFLTKEANGSFFVENKGS